MENINNIKLKKPVLIIVAFLLFNIGCVDLNEEPKDFPSPDNFYGTENQIISALAGSMAQIYSAWSSYSYGWYEFQDDHNTATDLVFSASYANWAWTSHYGAIGILNSVVDALNEDRLGSAVPQETKDGLMGQARFLRGFNYFSLVRLYGDVPIITEETDIVNSEISRAPIREVYDQIIADLEVAAAKLPNAWPADYAGRPAKDAARGFLAKVYLTMATAPLKDASNYAKARDMAKLVMDNGVYSLIPDVHDVFELDNKLGPENMFSFNSTDDDIATLPQIWLPGNMGDGWSDYSLEKSWAEAYPEQPRKDAYMILEDWDGVSWKDWNGFRTPHLRKYVYDPRDVLERYQSTPNIPLMRYADVLLIYAEAANMANGSPTQEAADAANMIIDRANGGVANPAHPRLTTAMSVDDFDAAVINERGYELFFEYDRWYDLLRKEILCEVMRPEVQVNCDINDYLLPIPQADLRINPLMTQNPGYTSPGGS